MDVIRFKKKFIALWYKNNENAEEKKASKKCASVECFGKWILNSGVKNHKKDDGIKQTNIRRTEKWIEREKIGYLRDYLDICWC